MRRREGGGFFAAGASFERALRLLTDGAFKVFALICLRAERAGGRLAFRRAELARAAGKSRTALGRSLRELAAKGVIELEAAPNQHRRARLRVRKAFWPYESEPATAAGAGRAAYIGQVRRIFERPRCVQGSFGPADERLAGRWHDAGLELETLRRACLLGSVRKSMELIDRPQAQPIRSLHYFAPLVEEVLGGGYPAGYWQHVERNLRRCERYWQEHPERVPGPAGPLADQPAAAGPPTTSEGRREETR